MGGAARTDSICSTPTMSILLALVFAAAVAAVSVRATGGSQDESPLYQWDPHGYILYCPCMGRFGNQASHFLGSLAFAKRLNRTLAIPPWRSYVSKRNVPFTEWFQLEPMQSYYKSIPLEVFMDQLAPERWPPEERVGYCYRPPSADTDDCQMKAGNPFGPFWDELGVEFNRSEFTGLSYDMNNNHLLKQWMENYPPDKHPVLVFKGAPARFPVLKENRHLHKYVKWNDHMIRRAEEFFSGTMGGQPYIAVHMRIGSDWVRACEHAADRKDFMESPQCLEDIPGALVTQELCLPSRELVARHIRTLVKRTGITALFIASDKDPDVPDLQQRVGAKVQIYRLSSDFPQLDLVLLGRANHFIGNCVSSFTAFAKRERDANRLPSEFWGQPNLKLEQTSETSNKSEL